MVEPRVEQLPLPSSYGSPKKKLEWASVRKELEDAPTYWVSTVRPDGRPHVVPRDGIWFDDTWYYGGAPETVHNRNIEKNASAVMHIGDGIKAIIVEGEVVTASPTLEIAQHISDVNNVKYKHYGVNTTAETYTGGGYLALKARRVLAWTFLPEDATRFVFPGT
jgi:hypothetical protein